MRLYCTYLKGSIPSYQTRSFLLPALLTTACIDIDAKQPRPPLPLERNTTFLLGMSQAGRLQYAPDDIIHPVRSQGSGLPGVRDATKTSSLLEKHISAVLDLEEGSDYKTTGPQDRDIRKRQVGFQRHEEFCNCYRAKRLNVL